MLNCFLQAQQKCHTFLFVVGVRISNVASSGFVHGANHLGKAMFFGRDAM
jgi:hypothetical protein